MEFYQDSKDRDSDYLNAILVFHDKDFTDQSSRVEVYNFDVKGEKFNPSTVKLTRNFTFQSLYSNRLGFDFKVTCLTIIQDKNLAIFGLSKIGLMFYSLNKMKVLKIEKLNQ
jgi:hypothetical protein